MSCHFISDCTVLATLAFIYSALINIFLRYSPLATKTTILPRQLLVVSCNQIYVFSTSLNFLHYKFQDFFRDKWAIFVILVTESLSIITFLIYGDFVWEFCFCPFLKPFPKASLARNFSRVLWAFGNVFHLYQDIPLPVSNFASFY